MAYNDEKKFLDLTGDSPFTDRDKMESKQTESNIEKFKRILSKKDAETQLKTKHNNNSGVQTNSLEIVVDNNDNINSPSKNDLLLLSNNSALRSSNQKSSSSNLSCSNSNNCYEKQQKSSNVIPSDKDALAKSISADGQIYDREEYKHINEVNSETMARLETVKVKLDTKDQIHDKEIKREVVTTNIETEGGETFIKKTSCIVVKEKVKSKRNVVTFNDPTEDLVNKMMVKENSKAISKHLLRKAGSRESEREEVIFINNIIQKEVCLPDDVLVSQLFRDFKIMEFLTALFTLISN
jgi:hypothetical protein